jgi:hypothetical protein
MKDSKAGTKGPLSNLSKLIGRGENPKGFTAQTANGTAKATGTGWNKGYDWERSEVEPGGAWQPGWSNRTGE